MNQPPWLATLPKDWRAQRLRYLADISNSNVDKKSYEGGHPVRLCNYTDVYYNDFITDHMDLMRATATGQEVRRFQVRPGDVIITKDSESWDDIAVPACVAEELTNVVCGYHLSLFRPCADLDGRFLLRALQAQGIREQFWTAANGVTRYGLGQQGMKDALLPLPPLPTQKAIAAFLDRKTAAIDALIEKKQKLLDLLAEKRAALINQAVTKGLDPNVPMKDSGIPWIGEIPAHWFCAPLYSRYTVQLGKMRDAARDTGRWPARYLRNANIQWDKIDTSDLAEMDFTPVDRKKYELRRGDILMCEGGANKNVVGKSAIWDDQVEPCFYQKALHRIRSVRPAEIPRFLLFCLQAACEMGVFVADSNANIYHLTAEKLRVHRFPFPPTSEQAVIVADIDESLRRSRTVSATLQAQIDRLKEYRQALITAAVTGQLDITEGPPA